MVTQCFMKHLFVSMLVKQNFFVSVFVHKCLMMLNNVEYTISKCFLSNLVFIGLMTCISFNAATHVGSTGILAEFIFADSLRSLGWLARFHLLLVYGFEACNLEILNM